MIFIRRLLARIFDIGMYVNPFSLLPQLVTIWRTESSAGVSIITWLTFFVFQTAICLHGKLNLNSNSMFYGMGSSAFISLIVLILCFVY